MSDFTWITERLATGGAITDPCDVNGLADLGITHIINMRAEFDDNSLKDPRFVILWLPQVDDGSLRPIADILAGIEFAFSAFKEPKAKVFCHCGAGINRGPTQTYAILRAFGIPRDEAIAAIKSKRPQVQFDQYKNYITSVETALQQ